MLAHSNLPSIQVKNVTKTFIVPHQVVNTLKEGFLNLLKQKSYEQFHALNGVDLTINSGDFLGIVGKNGSGKSTLLRLMSKIYRPNSGTVEVHGTIAPFLELGVGFQNELTARENIFVNGIILGLSRKQVQERFRSIVDFAEIEKFLDLKMKNFSSGMRARLAFAIAKEANADIYLCDEVFAVGDEKFQQKCYEVFTKWKNQGKTIILVSHAAEHILKFCSRAILLHEGKIILDGSPQEVMEYYHTQIK